MVILTTSFYILMPEKVRIDFEKTRTIFKVYEEGKFVTSGIEYVRIFDGTRLMRAKNRTINYILLDEITIVNRQSSFKERIVIDEIYEFDNEVINVENVPVSHKICFTNAKDKIFEYMIDRIEYDGETKDITSPFEFGKNMKLTFQDGYYRAKVYNYKYATDKIKIRYRVTDDYQCFDVRLFDPEENPKGFIGYSKPLFEWNFEVIQEDPDIFTEVEVINETVLKIIVDKKHELSGGYKWDMAICNISGFDSLQYLEKDSQGGFNYSYPEDLNYIKLEYEGLPSDWCNETDGYGFVLFSSGSSQQLPEHFRIIFPEGNKEFKMFTGSGTDVLIGIGGGSSTLFAYNEKIVKDSTGGLHLLWRNPSSDLQYANSSDNGVTWTSKELFVGTSNFHNLLINSTDGLFAIWAETSSSAEDTYYSISSNYGVTWSTPAIIPGFDGNVTHRFDAVSAVMDDNDNVHICVVTAEWDDGSGNDFLIYSNYTGGVWSGITWINENSADDTDTCDIETDSNGVVYIVGTGSDGDDIDLWTSIDGISSARYTIHSSTGDTKPGIFIDKNDKIVIAWEEGTDDLNFANSTPSDATSDWDVTEVDSNPSDNMDIKITDNEDIYILYVLNTGGDKDVLQAFWNITTESWTARTVLKDSTWVNTPIPTMRGSRIGSDTITDRIDYMYYNDTDNGYYFDYFEVTPPPDMTPPEYSNFAKNITDANILTDSAIEFNITISDVDNNVLYWNFSWNCTVDTNWVNVTNSTDLTDPSQSNNSIESIAVGNVCGYMFCSSDNQGNVGCDSERTFEIQELVTDTCSCPDSGDWIMIDNCNITTDCDLQGNVFYCEKNNDVSINAVISNFGNAFIYCDTFCSKTPSCFG